MSRGLLSLVQSIFAMQGLPPMLVTVSIPDLNLYLTNFAKSFTLSGQTYVGTGPGGFTMQVEGIGNNTLFEAPSAALTIDDASGTHHAFFWNDSYRGLRATIAVLYIDTSGTITPSGRSDTYVLDADKGVFNGTRLRLASADAVSGTDYPKRTTQRHNCEHDFMGPECGFRFREGMPSVLRKCDHGFNTPNGCVAHWPDQYVEELDQTFIVAKPFSGPRAGLDHRLVGAN